MDTRPSAGRASAQYQPDLFDGRGRDDVSRRPSEPARTIIPQVDTLDDETLIALLEDVGPTDVRTVCSEIAVRSFGGAVPALEALWRRFAGFGIEKPLAEQIAVLETLTQLDSSEARATLRRILLRNLPASTFPVALQAAARAGLALPTWFVAPLLDHADATVRGCAFALADRARVPAERLRMGLFDRTPEIRRTAAIMLAHRGHAEARKTLLEELQRSPEKALIHALAAIPDEDTIVHLGRCVAGNPALVGTVIDVLRDMECPRAARLARRLEREVSTGT